jgi:hypothetical protein
MPVEQADEQIDRLGRVALTALIHSDTPPPEKLWHFTGADALVGMLDSKSLWLSMTCALNDRSEITYGLDFAKECLDCLPVPAQFIGAVRPYLELAATFSTPHGDVGLQPFTTSFCEAEDSSSQWLTYGRSGQGFALAMNSTALEQVGVIELARVEYEKDQQRRVLERIATSVWTEFEAISPVGDGASLDHVAALTGMTLRAAAVRMKAPAFASEREWRLITLGSSIYVDSNPYGGKDFPMRFRSNGSRVVPYFSVPYETLPIVDIVLGASVAISEDDVALGFMLSRSGLGHIQPTRSVVPVRP